MVSPWGVVLVLGLCWVLDVALNGLFQNNIAPYDKEQFTKTMVSQSELLFYLLLGYGVALLTKNLRMLNFSLAWIAQGVRILVAVVFFYQLIPIVGLIRQAISTKRNRDGRLFILPCVIAAVLSDIACVLVFFSIFS